MPRDQCEVCAGENKVPDAGLLPSGLDELWLAALHQNHIVMGQEEILVVPRICRLGHTVWSWLERCCLSLIALLESLRNLGTSSVCSV